MDVMGTPFARRYVSRALLSAVVQTRYSVGDSSLRRDTSYDDFVETLAARVDGLSPQRRAAVFWLAGRGLQAGLSDSESGGWTGWFGEASDLSVGFIVDGRVEDNLRAVWEQTSAPTEPGASQLLHSVIICLSSPLAIAMEPEKSVGSWIEHALFPVIQQVSLDLFDDIAFPDDDGLEEVFADDRVQAAGDYCASICASLADGLRLDREVLDDLLEGAGVLNGAA